MPRKILVLLAHPALHRSRINRPLAEAAAAVPAVTLIDLYRTYPDFEIDVEVQQALLLDHDVIVFQHPMFWYSSPALLKEWQDLVLEFGFAYGHGAAKLEGKWLLSAVTTGGAADAYQRGGHNHYPIQELLRPFEQTARFCAMEYLPPHVVHGTHTLDGSSAEDAARNYGRCLERLSERTTDLAGLTGPLLNPLGEGVGA